MVQRKDYEIGEHVTPAAMSSFGDSFAEALEHFLSHMPHVALASNDETEIRVARFQTEATNLPELARNAFEAVATLATGFDLGIVRVTVDGHRPIEGGHRCWGSVELAPTGDTEEPAVIVDGPEVSQDPDTGEWRIDVWFVDD
jgi:hypothetical protein